MQVGRGRQENQGCLPVSFSHWMLRGHTWMAAFPNCASTVPAPGKPRDVSDTGPQTCQSGIGPLGGGGQAGVEGTLYPSGPRQPPLLESLGESLAPGPLTGVFFYIY